MQMTRHLNSDTASAKKNTAAIITPALRTAVTSGHWNVVFLSHVKSRVHSNDRHEDDPDQGQPIECLGGNK
jgi:hypothetical protein